MLTSPPSHHWPETNWYGILACQSCTARQQTSVSAPQARRFHSQSVGNGLEMVEELIDLLAEPGALTQKAGPLYRRLSSALETAMERGHVTPGTLLPPERVLAARIGVSRSTVVAAYERLREAGLVERRQGSGTRIAAAAVAMASGTREAELVQALHRNALFRGVIEGTKGGIDFLGAYLPATQRLS